MTSPMGQSVGGVDVSRETVERLTEFADLLKKWNRKINLVSQSTLNDIWKRHIEDSAQLVALTGPKLEIWADFGSGAGFPGVVVAALLAEHNPEAKTILVESDKRKAAFLRSVSHTLAIPMTIKAERIEALEPLNASVISARALAPLNKLLSYVETHLESGGVALFPKGEGFKQEIEDARKFWHFDCQTYPSKTNNDAVVMSIRGVERARPHSS